MQQRGFWRTGGVRRYHIVANGPSAPALAHNPYVTPYVMIGEAGATVSNERPSLRWFI